MTRNCTFLWILLFVPLLYLLVGCTANSTTKPSTSGNAIAWADDFSDGDADGWAEGVDIEGDEYFVRNGVLTFGDSGGDISHLSDVKVGTWSADVFIPYKDGITTDITFIGSEISPGQFRTVWLTIENLPQTTIRLQQFDGSTVTLKRKAIRGQERLTGWHHIDITRDQKGNVRVFFDKELVIDSFVYFPYVSEYFYFASYSRGPALDNVVVRNEVIDFNLTQR